MSGGRSDVSFYLFGDLVLMRKNGLEGNDAKRKRKFPCLPCHHRQMRHTTPTTRPRVGIDKFTSKPSSMLLTASKKGLINLILKKCSWNEEFEEVLKIYKGDFQCNSLETQLVILPGTVQIMGYNASRFTIKDLIQMIQDMDRARKILLNELVKVMKVLLVLPL